MVQRIKEHGDRDHSKTRDDTDLARLLLGGEERKKKEMTRQNKDMT